jgi:hypothetical protein
VLPITSHVKEKHRGAFSPRLQKFQWPRCRNGIVWTADCLSTASRACGAAASALRWRGFCSSHRRRRNGKGKGQPAWREETGTAEIGAHAAEFGATDGFHCYVCYCGHFHTAYLALFHAISYLKRPIVKQRPRTVGPITFACVFC